MIDFTTETERKRCKQIEKCQSLLSDVTGTIMFGTDTRKATNRLIKLRNYLNGEFPDKEKSEMLNALVAIWKWCSQDLAEKAYEKDAPRNFEITLKEIRAIIRPFVEKASKLGRCGGAK